jgi:hypothetical protein
MRTLGVTKSMTEQSDIDSWLGLAGLVQRCADGSWIFRGEPEVGKDLLPKAGRVGSYRGAARKRPYSLADEQTALESFKIQPRP